MSRRVRRAQRPRRRASPAAGSGEMRAWSSLAELGAYGVAGVMVSALLGLGIAAAVQEARSASVAAPGAGEGVVSTARCPAPSPATPGAGASRLPLRSLCALPAQAADEWHAIASGQRPAHAEDGTVFENAGKQLPVERGAYYREYTVETPGSTSRGARRLITGLGHELYYTDDHYRTFVVVDPTATTR